PWDQHAAIHQHGQIRPCEEGAGGIRRPAGLALGHRGEPDEVVPAAGLRLAPRHVDLDFILPQIDDGRFQPGRGKTYRLAGREARPIRLGPPPEIPRRHGRGVDLHAVLLLAVAVVERALQLRAVAERAADVSDEMPRASPDAREAHIEVRERDPRSSEAWQQSPARWARVGVAR